MTESEIQPLWNELKHIREGQIENSVMLQTHMKNSSANSDIIRAEVSGIKKILDKAVADTQKLYSSMPEDEHGRPSLFMHKNHHGSIEEEAEERRAAISERREVRATFWNSAASMAAKIIVGLAVVMILGEKASLLMKIVTG